MKTIYFVTSNEGKVHEVTEKLTSFDIRIIQKDVGYPEIQTSSLEEVARFGVKVLQKQLDHSFILEDAGIFIDALKGFPGVYSSYVYFSIGLEGILQLLKCIPVEKRTAQFQSVFAYATPDLDLKLFKGVCNGTITATKKGSKGFGYDPIFKPDGFDNTFAEMDTKEKNTVSHRAKSLDQLVLYLTKNNYANL
ncbi:MAG: XTP/dITP diphosphatase [Candidatus Thermoplasmatota archaeon]|nr:XTP/dITP diphosphatase [Candidatus Thermoplasmatota archaeon]